MSSGGIVPDSGFHSVMDRPEPVRRVDPPTTTMANTRAATRYSQMATGRAGPDLRNDVMRSDCDLGVLRLGRTATGSVTAKAYCAVATASTLAGWLSEGPRTAKG